MAASPRWGGYGRGGRHGHGVGEGRSLSRRFAASCKWRFSEYFFVPGKRAIRYFSYVGEKLLMAMENNIDNDRMYDRVLQGSLENSGL